MGSSSPKMHYVYSDKEMNNPYDNLPYKRGNPYDNLPYKRGNPYDACTKSNPYDDLPHKSNPSDSDQMKKS